MKKQTRQLMFTFVLLLSLSLLPTTVTASYNGDLDWMAEHFPGFADENTAALWLFDETYYSLNTITDASIYEYDLRIFDATLEPGKFGYALKTAPGSEFNLYYAEWAGKVCKVRMRRPKGEPSGLWGPTIAPKRILDALSGQDWTIEFWLKCLSPPQSSIVIIDTGHAYEPGMNITFNPSSKVFNIENTYGGINAECPTYADAVFDGKWHHIAFTFNSNNNKLRHYLDGKQQKNASIVSIEKRPAPPSIIPSSFVRPDGYEVFDKTADVIKYRRHRFNLSMGEDRRGEREINAMFDEFRISNIIRYSGNFPLPATFSRNYSADAAKPAKANSGELLFAPDSPKRTVKLGSRKHLFIDKALLQSSEKLSITLNPPTKRQELNFWPEKSAWRPSVVDVDGKIYLYAPESYGSDLGNTHLRISEDGINFTKPKLTLYQYEGVADNDYVISHKPLYGTFFKDTKGNIDPLEKYKMTAWLSNRGVYLYLSPDGIHWRRNETAMLPILSGGDAETYWDDQRGLYCTWLRRDTGHYTKENPGHGRAEVYFQTNDVLKTWPFKKLKKPYFHTFSLPCPTGEGPTYFKENPTGQVYRSRAIKYPWAPDTYFAFPWRFKADDETRRVDLGVSRDGINWTFFAHQKWYALPPEGSDEIVSMYGLIRRGDQIWQYMDEGGAHGDTKGREDKPRIYSRVSQRLDGFVSLDAGSENGIAVTRPIVFHGAKLVLNVAAKGKLTVEILDENSNAIPGFTESDCDVIRTDSVKHTVTWKGNSDVSPLAGKTIMLKINMQNSKLYALQFEK